jgi:membrane-bound lytic murein transglycosylase B
VRDTDGGALDGDATYDHAVGPMQLLPSAWRRYGRDGNGDGKEDPQNMYDAAAAAAVMLCRYGPLDTDAGLRTTFFHYNPSNAYVDEVLGYTHDYATFAIPPRT